MIMDKAIEDYINRENLNKPVPSDATNQYIDIEKETKRNSVLLDNPFLYSNEYSDLGINTIEEYYVKYKKENVHFGDIVRSTDLRSGKKKKTVRRIFELWKLDFTNKITKILHNDVRLLGAKPEILKVKFLQRLLLSLFLGIYIFFIVLMILGDVDNNFLSFVKRHVDLSLDSSLYFGVFVSGVVLSIGGIVLSIIHNSSARRFNRIYAKNDKALSSSKSRIMKEFNKKYRQVYSYYMKNIKKDGIFLAYEIDKVSSGERLEVYNDLLDKAERYKDKYERRSPMRGIVKYPIFILSVASILFILGYMVYVYFVNR